MRLWTVHPFYLDRQGLTALWREGLLAQKVLSGGTRGYRSHPQLIRFRRHENPLDAIATYLSCVYKESERRGWHFNREKITGGITSQKIEVSEGQLAYEFEFLKLKMLKRNLPWHKVLCRVGHPKAHPLFTIVPGKIEEWEKIVPLGITPVLR
jgi:hypothetical protein